MTLFNLWSVEGRGTRCEWGIQTTHSVGLEKTFSLCCRRHREAFNSGIYTPSKDNVKHLYVAIERLTFSDILLPHSVTCHKTQAQNVWLHNAANLSLLILMDLHLCFWDFSLFLILTLQFSKETWSTNLPGRCHLSVTLSYPPWWGHSFRVR